VNHYTAKHELKCAGEKTRLMIYMAFKRAMQHVSVELVHSGYEACTMGVMIHDLQMGTFLCLKTTCSAILAADPFKRE